MYSAAPSTALLGVCLLLLSLACADDLPSLLGGRYNGRYLHLTFDDGPNPDAPQCDSLQSAISADGGGATFFYVGVNINSAAAVQHVRDTVRRGHFIGVHGQTHAQLCGGDFNRYNNSEKLARIEEEILPVQKRIQDITGTRPYLYRPPFGCNDPVLMAWLAQHHYVNVMWSLDLVDYTFTDGKKFIAQSYEHKMRPIGAVAKKLSPEFGAFDESAGVSIVLMHESEMTCSVADEMIEVSKRFELPLVGFERTLSVQQSAHLAALYGCTQKRILNDDQFRELYSATCSRLLFTDDWTAMPCGDEYPTALCPFTLPLSRIQSYTQHSLAYPQQHDDAAAPVVVSQQGADDNDNSVDTEVFLRRQIAIDIAQSLPNDDGAAAADAFTVSLSEFVVFLVCAFVSCVFVIVFGAIIVLCHPDRRHIISAFVSGTTLSVNRARTALFTTNKSRPTANTSRLQTPPQSRTTLHSAFQRSGDGALTDILIVDGTSPQSKAPVFVKRFECDFGGLSAAASDMDVKQPSPRQRRAGPQ